MKIIVGSTIDGEMVIHCMATMLQPELPQGVVRPFLWRTVKEAYYEKVNIGLDNPDTFLLSSEYASCS